MKVEEICQKKNAGKRYMSRRGGWAFVDLQGRLLWENQVSDDGLRRGVEPVCLHPADLDGWEPEDAPASERIEDADTEYSWRESDPMSETDNHGLDVDGRNTLRSAWHDGVTAPVLKSVLDAMVARQTKSLITEKDPEKIRRLQAEIVSLTGFWLILDGIAESEENATEPDEKAQRYV